MTIRSLYSFFLVGTGDSSIHTNYIYIVHMVHR